VSRIRNALTARERLAWYLLMAAVLLAGLLVHAHWRLATVQTEFKMHVPPDLSQGATLEPDRPMKPNVYLYALYLWKNINEWPGSGVDDYKANIEKFKCYVSPDFYNWLNRHYERERASGALSRTRTLSAEGFFTPDYVEALGNNTWYVWLDMNLEERVAGEVVKDVVMRYPLYAYLDSRSCNEFGVSLGGFFNDPERL